MRNWFLNYMNVTQKGHFWNKIPFIFQTTNNFDQFCDFSSAHFPFKATYLTLIGPLFRNIPETTKAKSVQGKLSVKGPPFVFFWHCTIFFIENILMSPKGSPPSSFLIFCNRMYVNKSKRVPPFKFFRYYATFSKRKNSSFFSKKCFALFEP